MIKSKSKLEHELNKLVTAYGMPTVLKALASYSHRTGGEMVTNFGYSEYIRRIWNDTANDIDSVREDMEYALYVADDLGLKHDGS